MIGLTQILAETFRSLHTRIVVAPWTGPNGEKWELEIRVHDDPAYQEALADLGVGPVSVTDRERNRPRASALQGLTGAPMSAADLATADRLDRDQEEIVAAGFPWNTYPATYTLAEVAAAAPAVCAHLVVNVWTVKSYAAEDKEVEPERIQATPEEVTQWFLSSAVIPRKIPAEDTKAGKIRAAIAELKNMGKGEEVFLGGEPEGVAVAAFVLRESVQEHLFQERMDPLSSGSVSTPDGAATTMGKPASTDPSAPSSPGVPGGAETGAAPGQASSGSPDTAGPAIEPTTP